MRRDTGEKIDISWEELGKRIPELLDEIQKNLFDRALKFRKENTYQAADMAQFREVIESKVVLSKYSSTEARKMKRPSKKQQEPLPDAIRLNTPKSGENVSTPVKGSPQSHICKGLLIRRNSKTGIDA